MATSKPAPSSEELNDALDWIKGHKKRSVAHIIILLLITGPSAVVVSVLSVTWLGLSASMASTVGWIYFGLIALGLLIF